MNKIYFNNDYSEIAAPEIIRNVMKYSEGHYIGYGLDEICEGMADWRECYGLTDEDLDIVNAMLERYGLNYNFN